MNSFKYIAKKFTAKYNFLIPISLQHNVVDISSLTSFRSNNLSLKYWRFTPSDCKVGIRKFEFVAKTQFLCILYDILCIFGYDEIALCFLTITWEHFIVLIKLRNGFFLIIVRTKKTFKFPTSCSF